MKNHWPRAITLLAMLVLMFGALAAPSSTARANEVLDNAAALQCDATGAAQPTGDDAAAATALAAAGYTCARLFNKGQLDNAHPNYDQKGQVWSKLEGTIVRMRVLYFAGANTGTSDAKVCLDDDASPINSITLAPSGAADCLGTSAGAVKTTQGADNGPSYTSVHSASDLPEEGTGLYELFVDNLVEVDFSWGGTDVAGFNVNLGPTLDELYSEVVLHFNLDGYSLESFFQPKAGCATTNLTLSISSAGKSQLSYDALKAGDWTVKFYYSVNGTYATNPLTGDVQAGDTGPGTLVISKSIDLSGDVAADDVVWYYTITVTDGSSLDGTILVDSRGKVTDPDYPVLATTAAGETACTLIGDVSSSVTALTIYKNEDTEGLGFANADDALGALPLDSWYFTATGRLGNVVVGSFPIGPTVFGALPTNLDDFLTWTVCEKGTGASAEAASSDGWAPTYPTLGGAISANCYSNITTANNGENLVFTNFNTLPLTVSKDAPTSWIRTYSWTIAKSAVQTSVTSTTATFGYTVTATRDAGTPSGWKVEGTIIVSNPNPIPVTLTSITDSVTTDSKDCTVDTTTNGLTVPAKSVDGDGTLTATYVCTWTSDPGTAEKTNVPTANWDPIGAMYDTGGSATPATPVTFAFSTTPSKVINDTVTVSDNHADTPTNGSLALPATVSATTVFTYSRTFTIDPSGCVTYPNTASFTTEPSAFDTETPQTGTADASVKVCSATRTQGFWSSHTALSNYVWTYMVPSSTKSVLPCTAVAIHGTNDEDGRIDANASGTKHNELMGAFLADISKKTDRTARSPLDQARMQLLQQLMAAILNTNGIGTNDGGTIAAGMSVYCGTDPVAILTAKTNLDTFNNSGDATPLPATFAAPDPDGTGPLTAPAPITTSGSATSKDSASQANLVFWDVTN